jgi:hypothetical protein
MCGHLDFACACLLSALMFYACIMKFVEKYLGFELCLLKYYVSISLKYPMND